MCRYQWKDAFHFSRNERRGIFVLTSLLFLFLLSKHFVSHYYQPIQADFSDFKEAIEAFEKESNVSPQIAVSQPFPFNPNTTSKGDLVALGISSKVAQRIINYRSKGGKFYKKEDLQKIYGLSSDIYERLVPYINLPNKQQPKTVNLSKQKTTTLRLANFDPNTISKQELINMGMSEKLAQQWVNYRKKGGQFKHKKDIAKLYALDENTYKQLYPYIVITPPKPKTKITKHTVATKPISSKKNNIIKVDVNAANKKEWQQLKGIGTYYAKRIVNFREKLGGFSSIEQIGDTYGLPDSVFQQISPHLILSPIIRPISINKANVATLSAHPYIKKKQAKVIVIYRNNHGPYKKSDDLRKVIALSEQDINRIKPYLVFD